MPQEFSASEIKIARRIVAQADAQSKNKIQVMDPNNPPKERYVHQRFPMMVYDHRESKPAHDKTEGLKVGNIVTEQKVHVPAKLVTKLVHTEAQLAQALAKGWSEEPPSFAVETEADDEEAAPETEFDQRFDPEKMLRAKTRNELLGIAKSRGVKVSPTLTKEGIIALLLELAEV